MSPDQVTPISREITEYLIYTSYKGSQINYFTRRVGKWNCQPTSLDKVDRSVGWADTNVGYLLSLTPQLPLVAPESFVIVVVSAGRHLNGDGHTMAPT